MHTRKSRRGAVQARLGVWAKDSDVEDALSGEQSDMLLVMTAAAGMVDGR